MNKIDSQNFGDVLDNIKENIRIEEQGGQTNPDEINLMTKMDMITINNGWNDNNERVIISVGENAASYKWMHDKSAMYYSTIHKILSIILIIFNTGLSAETIVPYDTKDLGIDITRRVFTYIVTVISLLLSFLKYEKLAEKHLNQSSLYSQFYHDIQQQMCMYRKNRQNAIKYTSDKLKGYDSLIMNAPQIPLYVVNLFKSIFKNTEISIPDIADKIQKIDIITETPSVNKSLGFEMDLCPNKSNLNNIHNAFHIPGDITDIDIQKADEIELQNLRKIYLENKGGYEYNRFLQHTTS